MLRRLPSRETEPHAFGILSALLYVLLALVVLQTGCAHRSPYAVGTPRASAAQDASTVALRVMCETSDPFADGPMMLGIKYGTGTIIDAYRVLTARHVIECDTGGFIDARTADGKTVRMVVQKVGAADLAVLVALTDKFDVRLIRFGPRPELGQQVCASSAYPERMHNCGPVIGFDENGITVGLPVRPGNSGSGLYDARGRLVGVVTAGWFKPDGTPWGKGWAVQLAPYLSVMR